VSSTGSRRTSRPIVGSRSSSDRAMLEPGGCSIWWSRPWKSSSVNTIGGIRRLWWECVMWLMDCIWRRCLFLAEEVEPSLAKPPEMVLMVPRKGGLVGVMSVRAGSGS